MMQSTQQQIFYGVTAISCACLIYSIAKQKSSYKSKNNKHKGKKSKTPNYTFGSRQWFSQCFLQSQSTLMTQNQKIQDQYQREGIEDKTTDNNKKNLKQRSSKEGEKLYDPQSNQNSNILNQINEGEDQLFFKLRLRLLNSVKG